MFTGIIEGLGSIRAVEPRNGGRLLAITSDLSSGLALGASIAVNGVCLTAISDLEPTLRVEAVPETLSRTNLGALAAGDRVNLERSLRADGRLDGHIVQGHVDTVGVVTALVREGLGARLRIRVGAPWRRYVVEKGSIAVDGVSLTVACMTDEGFEVALIPHTLDATTLGLRAAGEQVNLEFDVLAKYVERLLRI